MLFGCWTRFWTNALGHPYIWVVFQLFPSEKKKKKVQTLEPAVSSDDPYGDESRLIHEFQGEYSDYCLPIHIYVYIFTIVKSWPPWPQQGRLTGNYVSCCVACENKQAQVLMLKLADYGSQKRAGGPKANLWRPKAFEKPNGYSIHSWQASTPCAAKQRATCDCGFGRRFRGISRLTNTPIADWQSLSHGFGYLTVTVVYREF